VPHSRRLLQCLLSAVVILSAVQSAQAQDPAQDGEWMEIRFNPYGKYPHFYLYANGILDPNSGAVGPARLDMSNKSDWSVNHGYDPDELDSTVVAFVWTTPGENQLLCDEWKFNQSEVEAGLQPGYGDDLGFPNCVSAITHYWPGRKPDYSRLLETWMMPGS